MSVALLHKLQPGRKVVLGVGIDLAGSKTLLYKLRQIVQEVQRCCHPGGKYNCVPRARSLYNSDPVYRTLRVHEELYCLSKRYGIERHKVVLVAGRESLRLSLVRLSVSV